MALNSEFDHSSTLVQYDYSFVGWDCSFDRLVCFQSQALHNPPAFVAFVLSILYPQPYLITCLFKTSQFFTHLLLHQYDSSLTPFIHYTLDKLHNHPNTPTRPKASLDNTLFTSYNNLHSTPYSPTLFTGQYCLSIL